jgi:hypothetical protein
MACGSAPVHGTAWKCASAEGMNGSSSANPRSTVPKAHGKRRWYSPATASRKRRTASSSSVSM